jgi:hypothetical protein
MIPDNTLDCRILDSQSWSTIREPQLWKLGMAWLAATPILRCKDHAQRAPWLTKIAP